jgi:hypothetical protein
MQPALTAFLGSHSSAQPDGWVGLGYLGGLVSRLSLGVEFSCAWVGLGPLASLGAGRAPCVGSCVLQTQPLRWGRRSHPGVLICFPGARAWGPCLPLCVCRFAVVAFSAFDDGGAIATRGCCLGDSSELCVLGGRGEDEGGLSGTSTTNSNPGRHHAQPADSCFCFSEKLCFIARRDFALLFGLICLSCPALPVPPCNAHATTA